MPLKIAAAANSLFVLSLASGGAASSTADVVASSTLLSSSSTLLQSLNQNAPAIGTAWVISSAILTTFSTTLFLKYPQHDQVPAKKHGQQFLPSNSHNLSALSSTVPHASMPSKLIVSNSLLQSIPRTTLLTLFRFAGSLLLGLLLHVDVWRVTDRILETRQWIPSFVVPAALLFIANYANSVSLDRIGISLTYTSKCGIPLITVLLTLVLDGRQALPSMLALLSLLPIAAGIALASWSAPSFELPGFMAAIASTTAQSALNVSSKRVMTRTGVNGPVAQRCMVAVGLILTLIMSAGQEVFRRFAPSKAKYGSVPASVSIADQTERGPDTTDKLALSKLSSQAPLPPVWLTILAFGSYHLEYLLSFMFVKLVQPITYGTLDAVRRLGIILAGRAMFGGAPLTWLNRSGIALALLGALGYSLATSG